MEGLRVFPIGKVCREDGDTFIELDPKYLSALQGLENFNLIQLLWWFDKCDNDQYRNSLTESKPYKKGPDVLGVFATRSPCRPNPIGLSTVETTYIDMDNGRIGITYTDADDGTPVLDIKPYTPSIDRAENPEMPEWCRHWPDCIETSGDFDWEREFNF